MERQSRSVETWVSIFSILSYRTAIPAPPTPLTRAFAPLDKLSGREQQAAQLGQQRRRASHGQAVEEVVQQPQVLDLEGVFRIALAAGAVRRVTLMNRRRHAEMGGERAAESWERER